MADKTKEVLECPYCGERHEFTTYGSIDLAKEPELKKQVMNEEIFALNCKKCKKKSLIAFPCLFSDSEKRYLTWLVGGYSEEEKAALDKDLKISAKTKEEEAFADSYTKRIVGSINELKEKIIIADDDLDDRVIEVLKVLCVNEVIDQLMGVTLREVRYNSTGSGKKFLVLVFDEKTPSMIEINNQMYKTVKSMFGDDIEKNTPKEGCAEIDAYWAKDLIENSTAGLPGGKN
jgi:hypothetical protein